MDPIIIAIIIFASIFVCLFLCYFGYQMAHKENVVKQRVQSIEHETDIQSGISVETQARPDARKSELSDSFKSRILIPFTLMLAEGVQKIIPTNGKSFIHG